MTCFRAFLSAVFASAAMTATALAGGVATLSHQRCAGEGSYSRQGWPSFARGLVSRALEGSG